MLRICFKAFLWTFNEVINLPCSTHDVILHIGHIFEILFKGENPSFRGSWWMFVQCQAITDKKKGFQKEQLQCKRHGLCFLFSVWILPPCAASLKLLQTRKTAESLDIFSEETICLRASTACLFSTVNGF